MLIEDIEALCFEAYTDSVGRNNAEERFRSALRDIAYTTGEFDLVAEVALRHYGIVL